MSETTEITIRPDSFTPLQVEENQKSDFMRPGVSYWQDVWRRLKENKLAMLGLFTIGAILLLATQFDQLIRQARLASNEEERMATLHQAEKLFLDEAIMAPIFFYTQNTMIKPYVKNLHVSPLGLTYFDRAEINK